MRNLKESLLDDQEKIIGQVDKEVSNVQHAVDMVFDKLREMGARHVKRVNLDYSIPTNCFETTNFIGHWRCVYQIISAPDDGIQVYIDMRYPNVNEGVIWMSIIHYNPNNHNPNRQQEIPIFGNKNKVEINSKSIDIMVNVLEAIKNNFSKFEETIVLSKDKSRFNPLKWLVVKDIIKKATRK